MATKVDLDAYNTIFAASGKGPIVADEATIGIFAGAVLKRGTVLGRVTATGVLAPVDKSAQTGIEKVYAILATDELDTTSVAKIGSVYLSGEFNQAKLLFPVATNTPADHEVSARDAGIFFKTCQD